MGLTVLYDSDCGICTATATLLGRRRGLVPVAIQSPAGATFLGDLTLVERLRAFHVVSSAGERSTGGAALAPLARALPAGGLVAPLLERFPNATERAYALVARNRHRVSAVLRLDACSTGDPHAPRGPGRSLRRASRGRSG